MKNILTLCTLFLAGPIAAFAGEPNCDVSLDVRFLEGAPVDRFVLTNGSERGIIQAEVQFDLRPSAGKLIFDTQSGGSGVEVYQPFQSTAANLDVADGAEGLRMPLGGLEAGASISFTIDVDDRLTASDLGQIRVSGSEIQGTVVTLTIDEHSYSAVFNAKNLAVIDIGCADKT